VESIPGLTPGRYERSITFTTLKIKSYPQIKNMKINLTKKQYETLVKAVYLGNWMANANRTGQSGDPHMKEYEEITDYIFSLASEFGFSKTFEHDLECDEHGKTTEVNLLHEEYDEETFWEELCGLLGERDFFRKYSKDEREKMNQEECFLKLQECIIAWEQEAEEYGVERLETIKQAKDLGINI